MPAVVAALALAGAAWLIWAGRGSARSRLAVMAPARSRWVPRVRVRAAFLVAGAAAGGWLFAGPIAGLAAGFYAGAAVRVVGARRRSRADAASARAAFDVIAWIADDLRAGQLPAAALGAAARAAGPALDDQSRSALREAANQSAVGRSAVPVLRSIAHPATRPVFGPLAAALAVADTGIPLVGLLGELDTELRARQRAAEKAAAQLAAARATAGLLSALPLLGLAMGQVLGADPVRTLFSTAAGGACVVGAVALHTAGAAWVQRITVRAVTR